MKYIDALTLRGALNEAITTATKSSKLRTPPSMCKQLDTLRSALHTAVTHHPVAEQGDTAMCNGHHIFVTWPCAEMFDLLATLDVPMGADVDEPAVLKTNFRDGVHNTINGPTTGPVVQAGVIHNWEGNPRG